MEIFFGLLIIIGFAFEAGLLIGRSIGLRRAQQVVTESLKGDHEELSSLEHCAFALHGD